MTVHRLAAASALGATLLWAAGCAETPSAASQNPTTGADQMVAKVGDRTITLKDVDEKWEQFDSGERARINQLLYQNRRTMLEQLVGDLLIERAAKAAN